MSLLAAVLLERRLVIQCSNLSILTRYFCFFPTWYFFFSVASSFHVRISLSSHTVLLFLLTRSLFFERRSSFHVLLSLHSYCTLSHTSPPRRLIRPLFSPHFPFLSSLWLSLTHLFSSEPLGQVSSPLLQFP